MQPLHQYKSAGLTVLSGTPGPAHINVGSMTTAPWRGPLADELLLLSARLRFTRPPEVQITTALEDNHHPGFVEWGGAQIEQKLGYVAPESARNLETPGPDILGQDGH